VKAELNDRLTRLDESSELKFEYGMAILELSQKTAKIYPNKSVEQKRIIISELFHSIIASGDRISVTLTKLAKAIAKKTEETRDKLQGPKSDERQDKN